MRNVKKQLLKLLALSGNSRTRWTKSELDMEMDAAFIDAYFGGLPPPVLPALTAAKKFPSIDGVPKAYPSPQRPQQAYSRKRRPETDLVGPPTRIVTIEPTTDSD